MNNQENTQSIARMPLNADTKCRGYLDVTVTTSTGRRYKNPLKLEESHLLVKLAKENTCITVFHRKVSVQTYALLFGV